MTLEELLNVKISIAEKSVKKAKKEKQKVHIIDKEETKDKDRSLPNSNKRIDSRN